MPRQQPEPTHTFETRSDYSRTAVNEGDIIVASYTSPRYPTVVTYHGVLAEVEEHPMSLLLKLEPYYKHRDRRYLSLFDDDSNIHSVSLRDGPRTLNVVSTRVSCEVFPGET